LGQLIPSSAKNAGGLSIQITFVKQSKDEKVWVGKLDTQTTQTG
jgi:hypothetical protein